MAKAIQFPARPTQVPSADPAEDTGPSLAPAKAEQLLASTVAEEGVGTEPAAHDPNRGQRSRGPRLSPPRATGRLTQEAGPVRSRAESEGVSRRDFYARQNVLPTTPEISAYMAAARLLHAQLEAILALDASQATEQMASQSDAIVSAIDALSSLQAYLDGRPPENQRVGNLRKYGGIALQNARFAGSPRAYDAANREQTIAWRAATSFLQEAIDPF